VPTPQIPWEGEPGLAQTSACQPWPPARHSAKLGNGPSHTALQGQRFGEAASASAGSAAALLLLPGGIGEGFTAPLGRLQHQPELTSQP